MPTTPILKMERHALATTLEPWAAGEGNTLVGYACRFNEPVHPYLWWPEYTERLDPGALTRTLKDRPDVRALRNHDWNLILGRGKNGTLRLSVDQVGLRFELDLPDTTLGRDTREDIRSGNIDGCSIGFMVPDGGDRVLIDNKADTVTRTILDMDLFEITPACTLPANENAQVELRSLILTRANDPAQPFHPRLAMARALRSRTSF